MNKMLVILLATVGILVAHENNAQDKPAYKLVNAKNKTTKWTELIKEAQRADIILFGEIHNNCLIHWLTLQLVKDLQKSAKGKLVLGAEMFETDNQSVLNEYLSGKLSEKQFEGGEARLWPNYKTDYKPLVVFAKDNNIPLVATNIPRRYAGMVAKEGLQVLDKLDSNAKTLMMPLPFVPNLTLPGYKKMIEEMGSHAGMNTENMAKAQAVKDATMAFSILKNFKQGQKFVHINGSYHSNGHDGIFYYLKESNQGLKILSISSLEESETEPLKWDDNLADFIFMTPEDMAKSY